MSFTSIKNSNIGNSMAVVESYLNNDIFLISIAHTLFEEAKNEKLGHTFKKTIPAMLFYCLALESRLNTYGKVLFSSDYRKFRESSNLKEKVRWFLRRLNVYENELESEENKEILEKLLDSIDTMVDFRNLVVHSKSISHSESRELDDIEQLSDKFISKPRLQNDFTTLYSIESCERFKEAVSTFETIWYVKARQLFPDIDSKKLYGISHSESRS